MLLKPFLPLAAAGLVVLLSGSAIARGSATDVVMVRAEVRPSAVLKFEVKAPELKISDADIEIGFIDIAAGSLFKMSAGRVKPVITVEFAEDGSGRSVEIRPDNGSYRLNLADLLGQQADSGGSSAESARPGTSARSTRHKGPLSLTVNF